jgi:adenylate cyclase class IV
MESPEPDQIPTDPNREYEIVIQEKNIPMLELKKRIISSGGKIIKSEQIFYHIKYRHPYKKKRDFIRLRNESSKITLTHKIHSSRFPVEHEIVVNNFNEANKILLLLGCKYDYECHKLREIWELNGSKEIVFDTYPGVETYAELECDNLESIISVLKKLNLNTDLNEYKRIKINEYYKNMYGINQDKKDKLTFKTAYDILLNKATKNKDLLKLRLDEVYNKHSDKILELDETLR